MAIATPATRKPVRGLWIMLGTVREGAGAGCIRGSSTASEPGTEGGGASDAGRNWLDGRRWGRLVADRVRRFEDILTPARAGCVKVEPGDHCDD